MSELNLINDCGFMGYVHIKYNDGGFKVKLMHTAPDKFSTGGKFVHVRSGFPFTRNHENRMARLFHVDRKKMFNGSVPAKMKFSAGRPVFCEL